MEHVIELEDITAAYDRQPVLWDLDLNIPKGSLMGIVGPNGAGKTTLFRILTGEIDYDAGEVAIASYMNFLIVNGGIILPQFGDENDAEAVRILGGLFPGRRVYPIPARSILVGGGNIHCVTQQIPRG